MTASRLVMVSIANCSRVFFLVLDAFVCVSRTKSNLLSLTAFLKLSFSCIGLLFAVHTIFTSAIVFWVTINWQLQRNCFKELHFSQSLVERLPQNNVGLNCWPFLQRENRNFPSYDLKSNWSFVKWCRIKIKTHLHNFSQMILLASVLCEFAVLSLTPGMSSL